MTENEKIELFDKWYDENYDEWAEGEEIGDFWLGYLDCVYYQSGDIELRFSDKKESK